jgi:uncharacterized membrane protein
MADVTQKARRKRGAEQEEPSRAAEKPEAREGDEPTGGGRLTEGAREAAGTATGSAGKAAGAAGNAAGGVTGKGAGLVSELRGTVRDAAFEVLQPVAREATTALAKTAATKGPELVKSRVMPTILDAGGPGALAKGALSKGGEVAGGITEKLGRKRDGKSPTGTGRGRRLPVQEHVDVAVDLETAYDQWTQFEEFPRFMHRVERVEQRDDDTLMWHENIWGVRRSWEAEIVEQEPCARIVWRSTSGPEQVGVVTFHRLSDRLTRVQVNLDFQPKGLFEKAASGFRITRRALRSDLMRFRALVEMNDEATGAWRGRIEEGEVVEAPGQEREGRDEPEAEREEPEEKGYEEEEEPRAESEEREEPEEDEDYEEEEAPRAESDEYEEEPEEEEDEEEPEQKPIRRRRAASRERATTARRRRG